MDGAKKLAKSLYHYFGQSISMLILLLACFIFCILSLSAFFEVTENLLAENFDWLDVHFSQYVYSLRTQQLTAIMFVVTDIGDVEAYVILIIMLAGLFYFRWKNWTAVLQLTVVLLITALSNELLKSFFQRVRPTESPLIQVASLSYPSGHAMASIAFYGFLIYLAWRHYLQSKILKLFATLMFLSLIMSIGFSRIYLGVHYPTDVLAGFIAGSFWLFFCIIAFNLIRVYRINRRLKTSNVRNTNA